MTHWLYPANIKFYDVLAAFAQPEAYWPMSSKVSVGNVVYIYLAAPYKQIAYVTEVVEINLDQEKIMNKICPYIKNTPDNKGKSKFFMKLSNISSLLLGENSAFALTKLKQHGLNGMLMGPRNLDNNPTLLEYIKGAL